MRPRRIFFLGSFDTPNPASPRGGQQVVLQHVRILTEAGRQCHVVYPRGLLDRLLGKGRDAKDPFISEDQFRRELRPEQDIVVVPGRYVGRLREVPGQRKVLFSQGVGITMRSLQLTRLNPGPWADPNLLATLCVSESNAALFREVSSSGPVIVVRNSVDASRFAPSTSKQQLILTNTLRACEKNPMDTASVAQVLFARCSRGAMRDFELRAIEGYTHGEVGELLARARVLLFLSTHEGLPLLPLEAMLSDVVVLGFRRGPMTEIIPPEGLFEFGDVIGVANAAQSVLEDPDEWSEVVRAGRATATTYGIREQKESVLSAWEQIDARSNNS